MTTVPVPDVVVGSAKPSSNKAVGIVVYCPALVGVTVLTTPATTVNVAVAGITSPPPE